MKKRDDNIGRSLAAFCLIWAFWPNFAHAVEKGLIDPAVAEISLEESVRYSVMNSFEAKLAKLDLLIAETGKLYSESVFDAFLFGEISYMEDKRQSVSQFAGDDRQTNLYSAGVMKRIPAGTDLRAVWSDQRDWTNNVFVTKNPVHNAQLTFEASQPLLRNSFGFIDRSGITITRLAIINSNLIMQKRIESLIADVEKSYWAVVGAGVLLETTEKMLDKARDLHESNLRNFDMGIIEKGDLYASEANLRIRENDLMLAEDKYKRALDDLMFLMNKEQDTVLSPSGNFIRDVEYLGLEDCLMIAFDNSRNYKIKKRDIVIKNIDVKMKSNQMWPELDLKATFAMNGIGENFRDAAGKTTVADNTLYYAGLEFTVPIENRRALSEFRKASYEKEKAIVSLKEEERRIITDIVSSHRTLATLDLTSRNMSEAVRLQEKKLAEEEKRFRSGRSSTKSLIDYQKDLLNTRVLEIRELIARENARVDLEKGMGILIRKYEDLI